MAYALVSNGLVVFSGHDASALAKYLLETDNINISLPENPAGMIVGGYTVMAVNYVTGAPVGSVANGTGYNWIINGNIAERHENSRQLTLDEVKAVRRFAVEGNRDIEIAKNVTAHARPWQADRRSQELLGQAISLAQAGLPLPAAWRDANNSNMTISTIADLLAIAGAIAAQTQTAYAKSWDLKAQIDAATTTAEVEAIIW